MFSDFRVKSADVVVGELTLAVQELVIAKRDPILKIVFEDLDVLTLLKPFVEAARDSEARLVDLGVIAKELVQIVMRILSKDLTTISCIVLDTAANRKKVSIAVGDAGFGQDVTEESKYGYFYSPAMFAWVRENLTVRQEQAVVDAFLTTNDFASLVKNYLALAAKMTTQTGEDAGK